MTQAWPRAGGRRLTMLLSSAGRRVELLHCFRQAAERLDIALTAIACDIAPEWSAACRAADQRLAVPRADSPEFVPAMLEICERFGVDLLVPTIDTELWALAGAREQFRRIGTRVAVSSLELVAIARDKLETARALQAIGVPTPRTATLAQARKDPSAWRWPLLVKPRHGSAGRAVSLVASPEELPQAEAEPLIAQQLLVGSEYTVNMFLDESGHARCVIPHRRAQTRAGEVEKGVTERRKDLCDLGRRIAEGLPGMGGAVCFQAILEPSGPSVFEINARFGGGYPLADAAGASFAQWLLEEEAGLTCSAHDDWRERVTMLRYDAAIFIGA